MEILKYVKIVTLKYLLQFLVFLIFFDMWSISFYAKSMYFLDDEIIKNIPISKILIFFSIYYLYTTIFVRFITEFIVMIFKIYPRKKKVYTHYVEEYEILSKCINRDNSILYQYLEKEQKRNRDFYECLTLYLGLITLIIFDFIKNDSLVSIFIQTILNPNYFNLYFSYGLLMFLLFGLMVVLPSIIINDYINEKGLIFMNKRVQEVVFK